MKGGFPMSNPKAQRAKKAPQEAEATPVLRGLALSGQGASCD
jgi:hypothetical protein